MLEILEFRTLYWEYNENFFVCFIGAKKIYSLKRDDLYVYVYVVLAVGYV